MLEKTPTAFEVILAATLTCATAAAINQLNDDTKKQVSTQLEEPTSVPTPKRPQITRSFSTYTPPSQEKEVAAECATVPCVVNWITSSPLDKLSNSKHTIITRLYYQLHAQIQDPEQQDIIEQTNIELQLQLIDIYQSCPNPPTHFQSCFVLPLITYEDLVEDNLIAIMLDFCRLHQLPNTYAPRLQFLVLKVYPAFLYLQELANSNTTEIDELEALLNKLPPSQIKQVLPFLSEEFITTLRQKLEVMGMMAMYSQIMDYGNGKDLLQFLKSSR